MNDEILDFLEKHKQALIKAYADVPNKRAEELGKVRLETIDALISNRKCLIQLDDVTTRKCLIERKVCVVVSAMAGVIEDVEVFSEEQTHRAKEFYERLRRQFHTDEEDSENDVQLLERHVDDEDLCGEEEP